MAETKSGGALKRDIGLIGAAFIALNGVIGAGIFALPQTLAEGAGAASPEPRGSALRLLDSGLSLREPQNDGD